MADLELNQLQGCCGVTEIDGIAGFRNAEDAVKSVFGDRYLDADEFNIPEAAQLIFTQASRKKVNTGYGFNLAAYIKRHKLGTVVRSESARNPNSSNYIVTFVWTLASAAVIVKWAKRMGFEV